MTRIGLILMAVWLVAFLARLADLVPREVEMAGIACGVAGVALLFLARRRKS